MAYVHVYIHMYMHGHASTEHGHSSHFPPENEEGEEEEEEEEGRAGRGVNNRDPRRQIHLVHTRKYAHVYIYVCTICSHMCI